MKLNYIVQSMLDMEKVLKLDIKLKIIMVYIIIYLLEERLIETM